MPLTYIVNQYITSPVRKQLNIFKINFFTCNFAFHYLCESENMMKNVKSFILGFTMPKAVFHFLDYDGIKLFNLIKKSGGQYKNDKYFAELVDKSDKILPFG